MSEVNAGGVRKAKKPYPKPDMSKTYTTVNKTPAPKRNAFVLWLSRCASEMAWVALDPAERVAVVVVSLLFVVFCLWLCWAFVQKQLHKA